MSETNKSQLVGTRLYDNWKAFDDSKPWLYEHEYLLYSDAYVTGAFSDGLGPYRVFNLIPNDITKYKVRAIAALRIAIHIEYSTPSMDKTEPSRYHGGEICDEIAALISLLCGIRLRSSLATRYFRKDGDPQGEPTSLEYRPKPIINIGPGGYVLPGIVAGVHSLSRADKLYKLTSLNPEQEIALVRAARLYQEALWIAEADPNQSWLMLVAAVETAANNWQASQDSPIDRLRELKPDFVRDLEETKIDGLAEKVANEFKDSIGSTKKFVNFLLEYLPDPPEKRPKNNFQIKWTKEDFKKVFNKIYSHRSKALHDGMPFPLPMCKAPYIPNRKEPSIMSEKPLGHAMSGGCGTWVAEDTPMVLNTFEYIVREVLIKWWML